MNDYLVILGLSIGYGSAEPRDGAPMVQVRADTVEDAVHLARGVFGYGVAGPMFVVPAFRTPEPPDRRGLMGVTIIRGVTP